MGFHGSSSGVNVHAVHRWEVEDETERLAINSNPDNTSITPTNGLNCLCLQQSDGSYWRVSGIDPVEWSAFSGGSSSGGSSTSSTSRKTLFSVHAPFDSNFPIGLEFNNVYMNRVAPNIRYDFDQYTNCLWEIVETTYDGETVNTWANEQFTDYNALVTFLNTNLTNDGSRTAYSFSISCYVNELSNINPFGRIYGVNKFFSALKGQNNYKSTNYNAKTISEENGWDNIQEFVQHVYTHFLGASATPIFSDAVKTFWFSQSPKRMYDHHNNPIEFPSGNSGPRKFFSVPTNDTVTGVGAGYWTFAGEAYYGMYPTNSQFEYMDDFPYDSVTKSPMSMIRVSMYYSSGDSSKVMFYVKPVGMDTFYLGFHPELKAKSYTLFTQYDSPNKQTRLRKLRSVSFSDPFTQYGMNTSVRVQSSEFINQLVSGNMRKHVKTHAIIGDVRFLLIADDGTCIPPSRNVSIIKGSKVASFVLLK